MVHFTIASIVPKSLNKTEAKFLSFWVGVYLNKVHISFQNCKVAFWSLITWIATFPHSYKICHLPYRKKFDSSLPVSNLKVDTFESCLWGKPICNRCNDIDGPLHRQLIPSENLSISLTIRQPREVRVKCLQYSQHIFFYSLILE